MASKAWRGSSHLWTARTSPITAPVSVQFRQAWPAVVTLNIRKLSDIVDALAVHGVATIHEAQGKTGLLQSYMRPIYKAAPIGGTAVIVSNPSAGNCTIHVTVELCRYSDVLVVAPRSPSDVGYFGEPLASSLAAPGVRESDLRMIRAEADDDPSQREWIEGRTPQWAIANPVRSCEPPLCMVRTVIVRRSSSTCVSIFVRCGTYPRMVRAIERASKGIDMTTASSGRMSVSRRCFRRGGAMLTKLVITGGAINILRGDAGAQQISLQPLAIKAVICSR
ncbi:hypothetical protein HFN63_36530 [Rhizobium leguminosarum]|uniref:RraA family protein n=1 Tax=Rhizobium leguminosarum TaxID=384 RepID=UPI001C959B07|nr:hypothetical protein [Rhizobium leguminosarum]MBY5775433.1 hypothetical protein [Rhizobium leguminosarum]